MALLLSHKQTYKIIFILGLLSAGLLSAAFAFEYFGGLVPCKLCIWQRVPHGLIILVALLALVSLRAGLVLFIIAALALTNAGISVYHVGVEQALWAGPASCSGTLDNNLSSSALLDQLLATPMVRCDEVAWSFLGVSMAGWNLLFSLTQASLARMHLRRG
jgi:disulfide bond formation protein DsbB